MAARILVVDDDPEVLGTTARALNREGYQVDTVLSAVKALTYLEQTQVDLVVLDIMMPGMDGLELCRLLRAQPDLISLPILFMSARAQTEDVVIGLDAGGDDYIIKPFKLAELNARVRALLRRYSERDDNTNDILETGNLRLVINTFQAEGDNGLVRLTATEFRLLHYLMTHPGEVLSVDVLLNGVWHYPTDSGDPNLVRAHIRNLRRKLEADPSNPRYLRTIHGVGYIAGEEE
jgi:DNA-binding response OmpR family regulator